MPENNVLSVAGATAQFGISLPDSVPGHIGGKVHETESDSAIQHVCPATEELLHRVQECSSQDVNTAVSAARDTFDNTRWARMPHTERKMLLRRLIDVIDANKEELAAIQTLEVGIPFSGVKAMHMPRTIENFEFFIEAAGTVGGHTYTQTGVYTSVVTREAAGVVALLSPWNAPLVLSSMKLAAALALGNSCVIKASEYSAYSLFRFVEIMHEADLPRGLINLVNGRGELTGKALTEHPGVDVIGFIGGTQTGKAIMASAAGGIKKVGLELGGKSANIVLKSANLGAAIDGSLLAILAGNGAQCLSGSRILVEEAVADEFIETFVRRMKNVVVGDPFDARTEIGPMAFAAHRDKVLSYAAIAQEEGAEILCGGRASDAFDKGYFVEPTVAAVDSNQLRICQEEVFGPFVTVQRIRDADEAVALANESSFGLVSYVWSDDLPSVMAVAQQIKAGTVWVNTPLARDLRAPFGGYKMSGIGRDGLHASVDLLTEEKTMMLPNAPLNIPSLGLNDSSGDR